VIYPLKTGIYALVGISERTFTRDIFNKGVRYAQIKISARSFHNLLSLIINVGVRWPPYLTAPALCIKIVTVEFPFCIVLLICFSIARVRLASKK